MFMIVLKEVETLVLKQATKPQGSVDIRFLVLTHTPAYTARPRIRG